MNPRARQSIPTIVTQRLPSPWTPPRCIDIGQLPLPIPSAPPRAVPSFRFAADENATVWIAVQGGGG